MDWRHRSDAASEGAWVWSPCNTPLSYTDGYIGEPNNAGGGQDCMEINRFESIDVSQLKP